MLQVENLSKSFGDFILFDGASFGIDEGEKIGLIAPNGSGKSTLMKLLTKQDSPDAGYITYKKGVRVGYLPQDPVLRAGSKIIEAVFDSQDPTAALVANWEKAVACGDTQTMNRLSPEMDTAHAWNYEQRATEVLDRLGITDTERTIDTLSGGEAKRVALARILIESPDLLLLDEPTNHLDLRTIDWLETYLSRSRISLLLVTHDRYFLDRICNRIVEIDDRRIYTYHGGYDYYIEKRDERITATEAERSRSANLLRKELDWMRRQPQARAGKAKYRIDAFYELEKKAAKRPTEISIDLSESKAGYIGKKIFAARSVSKSYGSKIIVKDFSYDFERYDKVGIIGENGVGKTTFLRLLLGLEQPDSGFFEIGETVRFGYYSQEMPPTDEDKKVIDLVSDIADTITFPQGHSISATQLLSRFLFSPDRQHTPVHKLSGGEKRRLYLCTVLITAPNFLVLDEPTNDLDILTLNILEDYLSDFAGCVLIVSHDRFFMDKVVRHLFTFDGNGLIGDFPGHYSQWREQQNNLAQAPESKKPQSSPQTTPSTTTQPKLKKKLSYKEQRELEGIQIQIPALEAEKEQLEQQMSSGTMLTESLTQAAQRIGTIIEEIDDLTLRWLEMEDSLD